MSSSTFLDAHRLVQIEIPVSDFARSLDFYAQVLGWEESPCDLHNYKVLQVPAEATFGISLVGPKKFVGPPEGPILYFQTSDPDAIVQKATSFFGHPPQVKERLMSGYGKIRVIMDPDGHKIGLLAPAL